MNPDPKLLNLFKWKESPHSLVRGKKELMSQMMDVLERYHYQEHPKGKDSRAALEVEYTLKMKKVSYTKTLLTIELRVGTNRLYVVRNIQDFLSSVENQQSYFFTSHFSYDPQEHTFHAHDRELINILLSMMKVDQFYSQSAFHYTSPAGHDQRSLLIPPSEADQLLSQLSGRQVVVEADGVSYSTLEWTDRIPPLHFQLNKLETTGYALDLHVLQSKNLLTMYHYLFDQGIFYKIPEPQFTMLMELKKVLSQQTEVYIEQNQIEPVISSMVPSLSKIGKVHIAESISERMIQPPLQIKLFLDLDEKRLLAKLEYHYRDITILPLQNKVLGQRKGTILVRDFERENQCMALIESSPFKWNGSEMYLDQDEDIFSFLLEVLPELEHLTEIYTSSAVKNMLGHELSQPITNIDLNPYTNLLEVNFAVEGIDDQEIQKLLKSVIEKKKYYRLANGSFISLEDENWHGVRDLLGEWEIKKSAIQGNAIQAPAFRGLQLEGLATNHSFKLGNGLRKLLDHMKHPGDLDFPIPASLEPTLRGYQKVGFQWLKTLSHYHFSGILADDMGLGKTLQAISFILSSKEQNQITEHPTLIVSPTSLIYNWKKECERFAPDLNVLVITGDQSERQQLLEHLSHIDVIVTSYPLLRRDIEHYQDKQFSTLILDEAQAIKNDQTQQAHAVRRLKARTRFALTGTPIENSIEELSSIFQVIMPGFFPGKQAFKQLTHEKISKMVQPFILRRMKKDVLTELPEKIETLHISELTKEQKKLYIGYLEKIQNEARTSFQQGEFQRNRMKILAGLTRLRQICCHPSLFIENYHDTSGKLEQLLELVEDALASNRRILIFSQFTSMLQIICQELEKRKLSYFYLDGKTEKLERITMTEQFNQGEKEIFLISLKAGGTGLNLTGADTVILYDLWWNPAVDQQAIDRAHRLGQKKVVQVLRLITQGTIEEKIYELQQKKKELIDQVIQPGEAMISNLTEAEIRELLDI